MSESDVADTLAPPPHAEHIVLPDGEAFIWSPHRGIVVQRATGRLSLPMAQFFTSFFRRLLAQGLRLQIFIDLDGLTDYTREAREYLNQFTIENLAGLEGSHFLLSSKVVALVVGSFKHVVNEPTVNTYFDRASFRESYDRAVAAVAASRP